MVHSKTLSGLFPVCKPLHWLNIHLDHAGQFKCWCITTEQQLAMNNSSSLICTLQCRHIIRDVFRAGFRLSQQECTRRGFACRRHPWGRCARALTQLALSGASSPAEYFGRTKIPVRYHHLPLSRLSHLGQPPFNLRPARAPSPHASSWSTTPTTWTLEPRPWTTRLTSR